MDSWISIRIGRVQVLVIISLAPPFWSSSAATMELLPVSFRSFRALRFKSTGAKLSGINTTKGRVTKPTMRPIQKVHLQLTTETNPEIGGPMMGPNVVHYDISNRIFRSSKEMMLGVTHSHKSSRDASTNGRVIVNVGEQAIDNRDRR